MNLEYLLALIFPKGTMLSLAQVQALRSQAHAQADSTIDSLCALALDGDTVVLRDLSQLIRVRLRKLYIRYEE